MVLADFGVAATIIIGLITAAAIIIRIQYKRNHPPLTPEEKTAKLEHDLAEINKQIEKIGKTGEWDI